MSQSPDLPPRPPSTSPYMFGGAPPAGQRGHLQSGGPHMGAPAGFEQAPGAYVPPGTPPMSPASPPSPASLLDRRIAVPAIIVLAVALGMAGTVGWVQTERLADSDNQVDQLTGLLEQRDFQIDQLESDLEQLQRSGPMVDEEMLEDLIDPETPTDEGVMGGLLDDLDMGEADAIAACATGAEDLPDIAGDTFDEQYLQAVDTVEAVRGASFPEPLVPTLLTDDQIRERIAEEVESGYTADDAEVDRVLLGSIGAIPFQTDLVDLQTDLLGEQVAGFYDPETQELVVRAEDPDAPLDVFELITLVHELEHALADATVGLPDIGDDLDDEDAALAELAIVEGDAVAVQTIAMISALSPLDLLGAFADPDALADAEAGLEGVPHYIVESLTFPYVDGPRVVCDALAAGGWDAVDQLITSPPISTAQILYDTDELPVPPTPIAGPAGWESVAQRTFGAAQLKFLFEAPAGDTSLALQDPLDAASDWRGGQIRLFRDTSSGANEYAVGLTLVDGGQLCERVTEWWNTTDPLVEEVVGTVMCLGDQVRVGIAADEATAAATIEG